MCYCYSFIITNWVNRNKKFFDKKLFFYGDKYVDTKLYSLIDLGLKYDFYLDKVGIHNENKDFRWKLPVFFSHYDYYYIEDWRFYSVTSAYRYIIYRLFFNLLFVIFEKSIFLFEKFFLSRYKFISIFFIFFFRFLKNNYFSGARKFYNQYIGNLTPNRLSKLPLYFYKKNLFREVQKSFKLLDFAVYKGNIENKLEFDRQLCRRNRFRFFLHNYVDYRYIYIRRLKGKFGFKGRLWKIVKRRERAFARFIKKLSITL